MTLKKLSNFDKKMYFLVVGCIFSLYVAYRQLKRKHKMNKSRSLIAKDFLCPRKHTQICFPENSMELCQWLKQRRIFDGAIGNFRSYMLLVDCQNR